MPNSLFPDALPLLRKVLIIIDFRGHQYAEMSATEYAVRVAGSVEVILEQDLVLLASPDTKGGAIVRGPEGFGGATYIMDIIQASGHSVPVKDENGVGYIELDELLSAMHQNGDPDISDTLSDAAAWITNHYNKNLPEADPS